MTFVTRVWFKFSEEGCQIEDISGAKGGRGETRRVEANVAFERAAELLEEFLGIAIDKSMAQRYTETAGAIYVQIQEEEVVRLEQEMPEAAAGRRKCRSAQMGQWFPCYMGSGRK